MGDNNTLGGQRPPRPSRKLAAVVVPMLGLIAVIVGLVVAWNGKDEPIGWFSYAPLSNQTFVANGTAFISQGTQFGLAVAVLGLLILAFWAGHTVGRRR